jgi:phage FluMu protein Com
MLDFRCKKCNALLAKEAIVLGTLEIKCKNCGAYNTVDVNKLDVNSLKKDNKFRV